MQHRITIAAPSLDRRDNHEWTDERNWLALGYEPDEGDVVSAEALDLEARRAFARAFTDATMFRNRVLFGTFCDVMERAEIRS